MTTIVIAIERTKVFRLVPSLMIGLYFFAENAQLDDNVEKK